MIVDRNIALHGVLVRPSRALLHALATHVAGGAVRPTVDAVYTLDEVAEVHRRLESGHARGKAVIAMPILAGRNATVARGAPVL